MLGRISMTTIADLYNVIRLLKDVF